MSNQNSSLLTDFASTLSRAGMQSLRRQLTWRVGLVFLLMALLGSLMTYFSYRAIVQNAQHAAANDTVLFIGKSNASLQENWQRNAQGVKAQIDFMRIFAADNAQDSWLRLRAYFAALEGGAGQFPSGIVLSGDGKPVFSFGRAGQALAQRLAGETVLPQWFYGKEHRTVYALFSVPLGLGNQGNGRLVLMQPLDAAALRTLAPMDVRLELVLGDKVMASSAGSEDSGKPTDPAYNGRFVVDGRGVEQRVVPVFPGNTNGPKLVVQQHTSAPLSASVILAASITLLGMLALVLWLVIGRWAKRITDRVAQLLRAMTLFANEHAMSENVHLALDRAEAQPDEIAEAAQSCRELMLSVLMHDREHFAYLQTLEILEEGVVELAADGRYLRASPGWNRLTGNTRQAEGVIFDSINPDDKEEFHLQFVQLLSGAKAGLTGRMRLRRADGKDIWIEYRFVSGENSSRRGGAVRGVLRDITQSYHLEKHVTHMALHDALTDLPNRVLMEDRCRIALHTAERNRNKVALGFLDLDHFKNVNDQFGHKVGDELLVALSHALHQCLRAGDTLARWGGDEFVVLLTDLNGLDDARDAIAKLEAVCANPIRIDANEFNATFSMGVAMYPDDANTVDALLSQADRAMFSAKQRGRNTVRFFADMAEREEDRKALYIQNRLATAIKEQQIQTWFQPIVDARTLRVVSCEALARWHDEAYGWVSPATFVPMAENLGLIREIGQQVWRQAIGSLHRWRAMGMDMKIAVNVSRRQLFTPSFTADLLEDLERLAIPVSVIDLEITESVAMEDAEHTAKRLHELTQAGFGIVIDDFGTGYSSLSQLHDMPASKIKIDISFVRRVHGDEGGQLIQAIVKIASAFKLQTVAEGVESAETAKALREIGVDKLQGYHFGKPMNAESFERYLLANLSQG